MPIFPIYDCDFDWKQFSRGPLPVLFDGFIYKNISDNEFDKEFLGHRVVDSEGREFIITGKSMVSKWRRLIPFNKKFVLEFEETGNLYTIDQVKRIITDKMEGGVESGELRRAWIQEISTFESFAELFGGT